MRHRFLALVTTAALAAVVTLAATPARGASVALRIESAAAPLPLFDGPVETVPHAVDGGDGSGPHPCWGPPGAPPTPTATGALDDALRAAGISWRGDWDPSFRDFFVNRIGAYASTPPDSYWSLTVNGRFSAGGCLTSVADGDAVRFYYGPLFGAPPGAEGTNAAAEDPHGDSPAGEAGRPARGSRRVAAAAARYLRDATGAGEDWARLVLALRDGEGATHAARALLGGRLATMRADGSLAGDVNASAVAVLALRQRHPLRAARSAAWLAGRQTASGGFGYRAGATPDVDTTGLATWALAVAGRQAAASRGASFLRTAQTADGGFPSLPGGSPNSQSTGLATVALRVAGINPRQVDSATGFDPVDYLVSQARRDGSIAYSGRSSPTPVWSTAQALLGLTVRSKLLGETAD